MATRRSGGDVPWMANESGAVELLPGDLARGDAKAREVDFRGLTISRICSSTDPLFDVGYERLWAEFGGQHELETREVLQQRLAWYPATAIGDFWLRYEMLLVRREHEFVAVRDHTAIVARRPRGQAVVHLSHVLIHPDWRRKGLAGWLRAWPIQTARETLVAAAVSLPTPTTLVAEMEHPDPRFPARLPRLQSYERAGFKKVDPAVVRYFQPDFRPPEEIDDSGGPRPLPFGLVLRRLGREEQSVIPGGDVREIVECLYQMYATGFRESDMAVVRRTLADYPGPEESVRVVAPTSGENAG